MQNTFIILLSKDTINSATETLVNTRNRNESNKEATLMSTYIKSTHKGNCKEYKLF
jgi:hypothetical protein